MEFKLPFKVPESLRKTARKHQVLTIVFGMLGAAILLLGQGYIFRCGWNWVLADHIVGVTHLNIWEGAVAILVWRLCFRSKVIPKVTKQSPQTSGKVQIEEMKPQAQ